MKNKFALISALCALFVLIFASGQVISASRYALSVCVELILPSLFPFFVLSILLSKLGLPYYLDKLMGSAASKLFSVSGAGISALFIGISGGYPLGASYVAQIYEAKIIDRQEAERLLAFCNNSGPAFIVGAVGNGVFGSAKIGILLYIVHILSALLTGLCMRKKSSPLPFSHPQPPAIPFSAALPEAVRQAVISVLNVCGFVVCFTVFTGLLDANGFLSALAKGLSALTGFETQWSRAALSGIFELGSAAGLMRGLEPLPANISLAAAILGWGGISVHFQTLALISDTDIKSTLHFAGRFLSALFSAVLSYIAAQLFI